MKFECEQDKSLPLPPEKTFPQLLNYFGKVFNSYYILEDESRGFVQCAGEKIKCCVEFYDARKNEQYRLAKGKPKARSTKIEISNGHILVRADEVLRLDDVLVIFKEYFTNKILPVEYRLNPIPVRRFEQVVDRPMETTHRSAKELVDLLMKNQDAINDDSFCLENKVIWIDWKECDEDIINTVSSMIGGKQLSVEINGDSIKLSRCGDNRVQPMEFQLGDRDVTIKAVARVIGPEYKLVFITSSDNSDTLAFMVIPAIEYQELIHNYENRLGAVLAEVVDGGRYFS